MELATAEYLTFLDPDNEASEDGYAKLLDGMENGKYELNVAYHLRAGTAADEDEIGFAFIQQWAQYVQTGSVRFLGVDKHCEHLVSAADVVLYG